MVIFTYLDRREPWRGREAAPKPRRWRGSPVRCGRNGKKAKNRKKSGDAGLVEDCRRARRPRRRRTSLERCRKWPESEPRAVTRRRVGDSPTGKIGAWGRVRLWLPVGFPLACRSASGGSEYVVGARKRGRRKNSPERVVRSGSGRE